MNSRTLLLLAALGLLVATHAQAAKKKKLPEAPPGMFSLPAAVMPGVETDVKFYTPPAGKPLGLWTSFPAEITPSPRVSEDPDSNRYRIKVPADATVGIYAVRIGTTEGLSDLQMFMIDDLPSVRRSGPNTALAAAQAITIPVAIDGACEPQASDYYRFHANQNERVAFEVVAQRMGSRLDPVVRILDATGREIAYVDDTPGLGSDCRFSCTFPIAGDYFIELHDAEYFGGTDRRYRLRAGDFPTVTLPFPLGEKREAVTPFQFAGPGGEQMKPILLAMPSELGPWRFAMANPGGKSSAFVTVLSGEVEENEGWVPHGTPQTAMKISIPASISGRFDDAKTRRKFYRFNGKKGEGLSIRARTRSVMSACNLLIEVLNPDGTPLAESKPQGPDDGLLDVTLPQDGSYLLAASELTGNHGPAVVYRLEVEPLRPSFSLKLEVTKVDAAAGGTFHIKVKCDRHGFDGPIRLSLDGDARTFVTQGAVLPADGKEADVEVALPPTVSPVKPLAFRVIGKAIIFGLERRETASTTTPLVLIFPRLMVLPPGIDGVVGLMVRPAGE